MDPKRRIITVQVPIPRITQVAEALKKLNQRAVDALEAEGMLPTLESVTAYGMGWMDKTKLEASK